jgi:transglutaminase-like putative cysteine protease
VIEASGRAQTTRDSRSHWLVRLYRLLRPREGYAVLILALVAVICLPAAVLAGGLIVGLSATPGLSAAALLVAWWLAARNRRRLRGLLAALALVLAGVGAVLIWGVHVLRPWPLVVQGGRWLAWWVGEQVPSGRLQSAAQAPPLDVFADQASTLVSFGQRMGWWTAGLVSGAGVPDNLVLVALVCLLAWGLSGWAGWWLARHGKPFVALLPGGLLLIIQVYWAPAGIWTLPIFLGALTMLLVLLHLERHIAEWESTGVDYSPEMILDTRLIGMATAMIVVFLAPTLPFLTSKELSTAFWRLFEKPYRSVEQRVSPSFASLQPGRSLIPPEGFAPGGLPRSHLLGGRPELSQTLALRVRIRSPKPDERLYWRGQTFAQYTGRGWEDDRQALVRETFAAGEPWAPDVPMVSRHPVLVAVTAAEPQRVMFFASGEPVSVDRPYWVELRSPGELVALGAAGRPGQYTVVSSVPDMDAAALRAAGTDYPRQIVEHYLQLPPDLPPELAAYAAEVTASAPPTPYDRPVAIEAALRRLPYTLDVPAPPAGREVTSWFLFDLKRGYCDYFATAMVVLARLNGIPARLAVGYTMGEYDPKRGDYLVTERNAHSWPELYFPGQGWIPFEPTSAMATPERTQSAGLAVRPDWAQQMPDELAAQMSALRAAATENTATQRRRLAGQVIVGAACGLLLCLCVGLLIRQLAGRDRLLAPPESAGELAAAYDRLLRWGGRLGRPPRPADTAREYGLALSAAAAEAAERARLFRRATGQAAETVRASAVSLVADYEAARYGPVPPAEPSASSRAVARGRWSELRVALRRLWLARVTSWGRAK